MKNLHDSNENGEKIVQIGFGEFLNGKVLFFFISISDIDFFSLLERLYMKPLGVVVIVILFSVFFPFLIFIFLLSKTSGNNMSAHSDAYMVLLAPGPPILLKTALGEVYHEHIPCFIALWVPSKLDPHVERLVVDAVLGGQASLRGRLPYITSSLHMRCAHILFFTIRNDVLFKIGLTTCLSNSE